MLTLYSTTKQGRDSLSQHFDRTTFYTEVDSRVKKDLLPTSAQGGSFWMACLTFLEVDSVGVVLLSCLLLKLIILIRYNIDINWLI